jgi:hypothetical protein
MMQGGRGLLLFGARVLTQFLAVYLLLAARN